MHIWSMLTIWRLLSAVYYSAHRHGDGTWVSAKSCPFDEATGRLLAFVALNGHGFYPGTGTHAHVFFFANNLTSSRGRVWGSKECHIFEYPGKWLTKGKVELKKLPEAEDRGTKYVEAYEDSELEYYHKPLQPGQDNPAAVHDIKVWTWLLTVKIQFVGPCSPLCQRIQIVQTERFQELQPAFSKSVRSNVSKNL